MILRIILNIIFFVLLGIGCNRELRLNQAPKVSGLLADSAFVCALDFQDNFYKDTISLYIGSNTIFDREILSSHPTGAFSGATVKVFKKTDSKLQAITSLKDTIIVENRTSGENQTSIPIRILVNDSCFERLIDISYYKFIGFSKTGRNGEKPLSVLYSRERFRYY